MSPVGLQKTCTPWRMMSGLVHNLSMTAMIPDCANARAIAVFELLAAAWYFSPTLTSLSDDAAANVE